MEMRLSDAFENFDLKKNVFKKLNAYLEHCCVHPPRASNVLHPCHRSALPLPALNLGCRLVSLYFNGGQSPFCSVQSRPQEPLQSIHGVQDLFGTGSLPLSSQP
jgi:hypothetical protein